MLLKLLLSLVVFTTFLFTHSAVAERVKTLKFNFLNAEIANVISTYAKASGRKFVLDSSVRGKTTILSPGEVSLEEAFSLLSIAMAINQFAISEQGDTLVVMSSRNAQRSLLPVLTELPPLKPERLLTMVFTFKHVPADEINRRLRILPSKDGEMTPFGNKMIVTDWNTNIHRIAKVMVELDQPGVVFSSPGEALPPQPLLNPPPPAQPQTPHSRPSATSTPGSR